MIKIPHYSTLPPKLKTAVNKAHYADTLCPPKDKIFRAFYTHPLHDTKVIILGQEPVSTSRTANGLAFGHDIRKVGPVPSTLKNIFKERNKSISTIVPPDYTLESWAQQGVLLLNTRLTTEIGKVNAHKNLGWEQIVTDFIQELDKECRYKVYMLWGKDAQAYKKYIDTDYNLVLEATHPSPFSAHRGFFGCDHFAEANDYLGRRGRGEIIW